MRNNALFFSSFFLCIHLRIFTVLGQYRPLPGYSGNNATQELMVIDSKSCTTTTECNWGFECKTFQRSLAPGAAPTEVSNCAQCPGGCRADVDCPQNQTQFASDLGSKQKCFHGCCNRMDKEKDIMRTPILRGGPIGRNQPWPRRPLVSVPKK